MNTNTSKVAGIALIAVALFSGCSGTGAPMGGAPQTYGAPATAYGPPPSAGPNNDWRNVPMNPNEEYDGSSETPFKDVATSPLSTFSSDVDTASYSNMRRQINDGIQPQGVRIEELVNYFDYNYAAPKAGAPDPFGVTVQVANCPWEPAHKLAMVGIQATKAVPSNEGNNIVFLIDVSGSMASHDKLPLLKQSFSLLIDTLGENDVVSIVTYAGSNRVVADSVPGSNHSQLQRMIKNLESGGSTGGAAGLERAYELAEKNFIKGGNNRVILATDGDFNVGPSSDEQMKTMIEQKRDSGIYISVLGFGGGNLKDSKMETIADAGNGNYFYIDTLNEARKVLVDEFNSTMFVVAQDLKLQVAFNGAVVKQYRLIGYNNRRLENEDFNNDAKDAGDVGAGHSVTAFYELVLGNSNEAADDNPYSKTTYGSSTDFFTVSVRYKAPGANESTLVEHPVGPNAYTTRPSIDFRFAAAVTEFGLILTDSQYQGQASLASVRELASASIGEDPYGLRAEFLELVERYTSVG